MKNAHFRAAAVGRVLTVITEQKEVTPQKWRVLLLLRRRPEGMMLMELTRELELADSHGPTLCRELAAQGLLTIVREGHPSRATITAVGVAAVDRFIEQIIGPASQGGVKS